MKRWMASVVVLFVLMGAGNVGAAVVLNESGGGTASVVYEGLAYIWPAMDLYQDTMILKDFTTFETMRFDNVTYAVGDLDWSGGFRWTERVYNNTGLAWSDYHFFLDDTEGVFFTNVAASSPNFAKINDGGPIPGSIQIDGWYPTIVKNDSFGTVVLSADRKTLDLYFAEPLQSGSFFDVHAPIEGLAGYTHFGLAQTPTIPEPASLIVWSLLGLTAGGLGLWRRKRVA